MNRKFRLGLAGAALVASSLAAPIASAHEDGETTPTPVPVHMTATDRAELTALYDIVKPYKDIQKALADGYVPASECTESPAGGMGVHYILPARAGAPIQWDKPALLLYMPLPHGKFRLMGAEYFKADADQDLTTDGDRPSLFGRPFDGPMLGHSADMPIHYDLHVWLYQHNPAGLLEPWNPTVHCPVPTTPATEN
ncbi:hypothetical protein EV189_3874 [Motilibacter rhizosphaerae]|uniref:Uncharacterized protein n=2 Tax=Motilibacter rhizosphaerae TaxID=598652 RepID=A0A4Q7NAE6_9ACTN|nr:hypothetical protein EV189_3874 [Motilibacter rhizosphaerae]